MVVLQIIDHLMLGGSERMSVNLSNSLAQDNQLILVSTRSGGPLEEFIDPKVTYYNLNKKYLFDIVAFLQLNRIVKDNKVEIIHAHSESLFWAVLVKILNPSTKLFWHDHFGLDNLLHKRSIFKYKIACYFVFHIFTVNNLLKEWCKKKLGVKPSMVSYLPNFPTKIIRKSTNNVLPGVEGKRILNLANLREQKDHINLIKAFID